MHQWVKALEALRKTRNISKNQLQMREIMTRSQYNTMLKAKKAPRFDVLDRVLIGMGVTWREWGEVYERTAMSSSAPQANKQLRYKIKRTIGMDEAGPLKGGSRKSTTG